jgi:cytochrome c biogenesis protein CcdA/thiol-disulfide isomerase/thioredoxin
MIVLLAFAFLAGIVTILSPCVLPVLPIVLSGSVGQGRGRPWGIVAGFIASFTFFTLSLSALVAAFKIPPDTMRFIAAGAVLAFGLVTLLPFLKDRFTALASRIASRAAPNPRAATPGLWGGLLLGLSLGLIWTPCVGPIMASVISLALSGGTDLSNVLITISYSAGTSIPLLLIMAGGRGLLNRFPFFIKKAGTIQRIFGAVMILTALGIFWGVDRSFQSWILGAFPDYGSGLTAIEKTPAVKRALEARSARAGTASAQSAENAKPPVANAQALATALSLSTGAWINSAPIGLDDLRNKVVLVDFWTYSCVNCLRTIPYLRAWNKAYAKDGLVIIGVHSPEFAFERSEANVRKAAIDLDVDWPVVQDNDFAVWQAFDNSYWPAHYIYGRDGAFTESHFGEGAYVETEALIQKLLNVTAPKKAAAISGSEPIAQDRSPETYLGYARGQRFSSPEDVVEDQPALYSLPPSGLQADHWAFSGKWTIGSESSVSEKDSSLTLNYRAAKVYLVISPLPGEPRTAFVTQDGKPLTGGDIKNGVLILDADRLYQLLDGKEPSTGTISIRFAGRAQVYAFTFG